MQSIRKRVNWTMLGLVAAVLGLAGFQAHGIRSLMMAPSTVATVDIVRAFDALTERAALEADLIAEMQGMNEENNQFKEEINFMQADLEDYSPGSDKFKELEDKLLRATYQYQARVAYMDLQRERRLAEITLELYNNIRDAAKRLAKSKGIDIVFVDDTKVAITPGTEKEITRQISARRMLYVNPAIEVTDEIIELMNREFNQAGPPNRNDG